VRPAELARAPLTGPTFAERPAGFVANKFLINGTVVNGRVTWAQMNADNVCLPGKAIYDEYASPLGLCTADSSGKFKFSPPPEVPTMQAVITATVVLLGIAMPVLLAYALLEEPAVGYCGCLLVFVASWLSVYNFAIWTVAPFSVRYLSSPGFPVPLWAAGSTGPGDALTVSPPYVFATTNSYFVLLCVSFPFLLLASCVTLGLAMNVSEEDMESTGKPQSAMDCSQCVAVLQGTQRRARPTGPAHFAAATTAPTTAQVQTHRSELPVGDSEIGII
jgi:hypothetical protein